MGVYVCLHIAVRNNALFPLLLFTLSFDSCPRIADDLTLQEGLMS